MQLNVITAKDLSQDFSIDWSGCNMNFFSHLNNVDRDINNAQTTSYQNYNLLMAGNKQVKPTIWNPKVIPEQEPITDIVRVEAIASHRIII